MIGAVNYNGPIVCAANGFRTFQRRPQRLPAARATQPALPPCAPSLYGIRPPQLMGHAGMLIADTDEMRCLPRTSTDSSATNLILVIIEQIAWKQSQILWRDCGSGLSVECKANWTYSIARILHSLVWYIIARLYDSSI